MEQSERFIDVKNVRCSFPHLFSRPVINGQEGKCGATLLFDPKDPQHKACLKKITAEVNRLIAEKGKGSRIPSDKRCLRKGEESTRPEYDGYYTLSTNHSTKPYVFEKGSRVPVTSQEECSIYAGCRVNARVQLWYQDNQYGKRVNANLVLIQFNGDDESLSGSHVSMDDAMSGFDGFDDDIDSFGEDSDEFDDDIAF